MDKNNKVMERLLQGEQVQWKPLGDVVEVANSGRRPIKASLRISGCTPYYGANNIQDYVEGYTHKGEYVLLAEDGSSSIENYSVQWATGKFWANNHVHVLRAQNDLSNRFLFYYLQVVNYIPFLTGGTRPKLTRGRLVHISIPIPPLHVQEKIVSILDTFTELTNELTKELAKEQEARQTQYEYYRDKLLTFEEGEVEWKTLEEAVEVERGRRLVRSQLSEVGKYAVYQNSMTPLGYYHEGNVKANSTFIICAGAAGEVGFSEHPFWAADDVYYFRSSTELLNKFLYYYLLSKKEKIESHVRRSSVPRLPKSSFNRLVIPIPPLHVQEEIVNKLDHFHALANSITEGLPREIELRQQQYEYYRDLLLSFPKAA